MTLRATIITFGIVFGLGLLAVVILPFVLGGGPPAAARPAQPGGAAPDQGVFRSDASGASWQSKSWIEGQSSSISGFHVNALMPDPADAQTLYLLTDGSGLWASHSRGDLWAPVTDRAGVLEPTANMLAMATNPDNAREWYVAVYQKNRGRVLMTGDGGTTFREIYFTPLERYGVFDLRYDRERRSIIIATGQGGLLESADQGRTWRVRRWFADGLIRLLVDPTNPSVWYVATPPGNLFRTLDRGASWADVTGGLGTFSGARREQTWVIDAAGNLYLGSRHGLLRSRDRAITFEAPPLIIPPDAQPVRALAVSPVDPRRISVAANGQFFVSSDFGASWALTTPPSAKPITHLLMDQSQPETIYAVVQP